MKDTRPRLGLLAAALVLALLCLAASALAADQNDPSFGQNGVARLPLPQKAARAEAGIWDLANTPEGKMAASLAGEADAGYFGAARFNQDGSIDKSFGTEGITTDYEVPPLGEIHDPPTKVDDKQKTQAQGVAVQADGKVVVVGYLELEAFNHNRSYAPILARYGTDGLTDSSFGAAGVVAPRARNRLGSEVLHAVAIAPGGRIIAVGAAGESRYGGSRDLFLRAYTPAGKLDRSFGYSRGIIPSREVVSPTSTTLTAAKVLHSGKVLVAGYLFGRLLLVRLTSTGKLDPTFGGGDGKVSLRNGPPIDCCGEWASLALQRDGKILLAGEVQGHRGRHLALARFLPSGSLDHSFGVGGVVAGNSTRHLSRPRDLAVQGDGRVVVVGGGTPVSGSEPPGLSFRALRYLPNGKLDRSFGAGGLQLLQPAGLSTAKAALTQATGRVVAGGSLLSDNFETEMLLSRYLVAPAG